MAATGRAPGIPGGKGPDRATKFVVHYQPFKDGDPGAVPVTGQPFFLWQQQLVIQFDAESIQQPQHGLHAYRTVYQTVGQPWAIWQGYSAPTFEPEQIVAHGTDFQQFRPSQPSVPDQTTIPIGGAGHPVNWQGPRRKSTYADRPNAHLEHIFDKVVSEYYGEIIHAKLPQDIKREAAAIVKGYSKAKGIPRVSQVDWDALQRNEDAVQALIALWEDFILEDDEILALYFTTYY